MSPSPRTARARPLGVMAVLGPIAGFSLINVIVKITRIPAVTFSFYRLWLGAAAMVLCMRLTNRRLSWATMKRSAPGGVLFGLNIVLFVSAIKQTSVVDVLIIGALQPALTLIVAGPLFGERVTAYQVMWTAVSVVGVAVVTIGSSGTPAWSLRGDVLAVGSLVAWTVYFLVSKHVRSSVPALDYMTTVTVVAAIVVTPLALLSGQTLGHVRWQDWCLIAGFVAVAQGGHLMIAWAHPHVDVSVSSLLILAEPIISAVAAFFILGEPLTFLGIVGAVAVVVSVAVVVERATREGRSAPAGDTAVP